MPKKKAPQDATLRNVRAANRRLDALEAQIAALQQADTTIRATLQDLDGRVHALEPHAPTEPDGPTT